MSDQPNDRNEFDEELYDSYRYVQSTLDGVTTFALHRVQLMVFDADLGEDGVEIVHIDDEPVEMIGDTITEILTLGEAASMARCHEVIEDVPRWSLEHSDVTITGVHDQKLCEGRICTIHRRSDHHMRDFPQHWRNDAGFMERLCPHGVGHPDPDELPRNRTRIHGCCGCCRQAGTLTVKAKPDEKVEPDQPIFTTEQHEDAMRRPSNPYDPTKDDQKKIF